LSETRLLKKGVQTFQAAGCEVISIGDEMVVNLNRSCFASFSSSHWRRGQQRRQYVSVTIDSSSGDTLIQTALRK